MSKLYKHPLTACFVTVGAVAASGFAAMPAAHAASSPAPLASPLSTSPDTTSEWWPIYGSSLHLEGAGYGHGRGMSQWGAEGAARQGKTVADILSFYYPNTKLVEVSSTWDRPVRVRLDGWGAFGTSIGYSSTSEVSLFSANKKQLLTAPAGSKVTMTVGRDGKLIASTGTATRVNVPEGAYIAASSGRTTVHFSSGKKATFRGTLSAHVSKGKAIPVNTVAMDDYLKSVVPSEVYTSWTPTTLEAQSIAARTYASSWLRRKASHPHYDVCSTTRCQMYVGVSKEHSKTSAAVDATSRKILTTSGVPIVAEFSATNGGWRNKAGVNYYGDGADPFDALAPRHRWSKTADVTKLSAKWPSIGKPSAINVTSRGEGGPKGGLVKKATIYGSKGQVTVTGDQLRWTLGLYSTRVTAWESGILGHWNSLGAATGTLGQVTSPEYQDGPVQVQHFEQGSIVWSLDTGAAAVTGEIAAKAQELGWEYTGAPLGPQHTISTGIQQHFDLGTITVHSNGQMLWTHGRIHEKWMELGEATVGQPLTAQTNIPGGYSQRFTLGTLVWSDYRQEVRWWPAN